MIYLVIYLWVAGSVMCYTALTQDEYLEIGEKVMWTIFWPFLAAVGMVLGVTLWIYEAITGNKVRF